MLQAAWKNVCLVQLELDLIEDLEPSEFQGMVPPDLSFVVGYDSVSQLQTVAQVTPRKAQMKMLFANNISSAR